MRAHDLTIAVRSLFHRPGFTVAAILLLALGAGANAAVFSVVRGVLLRPLAFADPGRLVAVGPGMFVSHQDMEYWGQHVRGLQAVAGQSPGWMMALVADGGEPLKVTASRVTANLFTTLGAAAALGRAIQPGDESARVAVLGDALWRSRFSAEPATIGRTIQIDQEPYTVIGIMPPGFEILQPGADLWVPLPSTPQNARATFAQAVARLARGASVDGASSEVAALVPAMRRDFDYDDTWGRTLRLAPLHDTTVGNTRPTLLILLGAVGLILMLAATNLGTLILGRSVGRAREMAVRTALGATRTRLLSQLLVEQAVLGVLGSLAGLGLARAVLPVLVSRIPADMPRAGSIAMDGTVFAAVVIVSVTVAILTALAPLVITARPSLQPLLRQATSSETPGRRRALGALVAAQIALAAMLGIGAGLMIRSLWNLQQVDPGFDPGGALMFRLQTTSKYRGLATGLPYLEQAVARVRALPGVSAVGVINHPPMSGYSWTMPFRRAEDVPAPGATPARVGWRFIGWDYFQAMRIPVRAGRAFTGADDAKAPRAVIVNETLARQYYGDASAAVGRSIVVAASGRPGDETAEIVGVSGDVHHDGLDVPVGPELYRPLAQTFMFPMAVVVRSATPPADLGRAVRQAMLELDPVIPVAELQPYTALIGGTLGRPRLLGLLLSVFAGAGLLLALVGTYGVVAYRVRQREREIGIRVALGAAPTAVARAVVWQGIRYGVGGLLIGLPAALALSRVMRTVVFGVTPVDPLTFLALPLLVVLATALASYLPARRAARIDPVTTMRTD
jgi:predicted permease